MTRPTASRRADPGADTGPGAHSSPADRHRRFAVNAVAGGVSNAVKIAIQLVLLPLMAHMLGPAEFGLYALALPTVSFFAVLADAGLGNSMAREDEAATAIWSTAFWILLATGIGLALIVSAWGVLLARFTHEPRLSGLMSFLSVTFVLITMSVLPSARLTRRGNLVVYAGADVVSTLVGAVFAVILAASGAGAWSLAIQYVVGYAIRSAVLNAAASHRPQLVFQPRGLGRHITTGGAVLGSRLVDFAGRLAENVVFGRSFGPAALGTYTFANQAPRFLCEAAQNPVWAALYAHALHADPAAIAALHRTLVRLLACVLFPVAFLISAAAPALVALLLGEKWASAGMLIPILVPVYALAAVSAQSSAVLLAGGRNAVTFWITAAGSAGRVLAVCAGPWVGPVGVAWGIALSTILAALACFVAPAPSTAASTLRLVGGMAAPAAAAIGAGLICHAVLVWQPGGLASVAIGLALGGVAYLGLMLVLEGRRLREDFGTLRRLIFRGRRGASPDAAAPLSGELPS